MADFRFELTDEEKAYLTDLVRWSIALGLQGKAPLDPPAPVSDRVTEALGAFVTLKLGEQLRGCIGHIVADDPLYRTIAAMAQAAAFQDPRFPPVTADEAEALDVEISVLSPITECPDPSLVEVGRHGLIMQRGGRQGLLLPQVATEWNWDAQTFLSQTCVKAGLPQNCWQQEGTTILWFEAVVF